ncbi:MAG TPA: hypothetical protein DD456_06650 [Stenotrophomonas sp.]|nr:hypothetical protein [Stenotrophomonas sp.]
MSQSFQPVVSLPCVDGAFVVDARPYRTNAAGTSAVELRYRYRGVRLDGIDYEAYYRNLDRYLHQGDPTTYNLGLPLDSSGRSRSGGDDHQRGDTLYLPPGAFSAIQVERLADCLARQQTQLQQAFATAEVRGSTFLGLMKTRTGIGRDGIARLVHADAPLLGIHGDGNTLVLVERDGRVLLQTNHTAGSAAESAVWGRMSPRPGNKPVLRVQRRIQFQGQAREGAHFLPLTNAQGRRLQDDYDVEWQ